MGRPQTYLPTDAISPTSSQDPAILGNSEPLRNKNIGVEVTTPKAWNLPSYSAWLLVLFSAHSAHLLLFHLLYSLLLILLSLNDLSLSEA